MWGKGYFAAFDTSMGHTIKLNISDTEDTEGQKPLRGKRTGMKGWYEILRILHAIPNIDQYIFI